MTIDFVDGEHRNVRREVRVIRKSGDEEAP